MIDPNAPVLVAAAQHTWRDRDASRTPIDALETVASEALAAYGPAALRDVIDTVTTVRFITDTNPHLLPLLPRDPGGAVCERLGIENAQICQGSIGGNSPQYLVNRMAERLASGQSRAVLLCGTELLDTFFNAMKTGADISAWADSTQQQPETLGVERDGLNDLEKAHGLFEPVTTYPLFEMALRHHRGASIAEHQHHMGAVCSRMSQVAATNPHAWRPQALQPDEVGAVSKANRWISYPYTKAMNAVLAVDMAAAVVMTTAGTAQQLGIDPKQMVYLRAGADLNEIWHVSEREELHRAPAIGVGARAVLQHAGVTLDEVDLFDIYSCFPSAVQIGCNEIGLDPLDSRGVTVTGGLPFFGGPGNNYSLHAIAEMVSRLGSGQAQTGLVTANGLYLTKHALGLYSTEPGSQPWQPLDSAPLQQQVDAGPRVAVAQDPTGSATIETYTVTFDREGAEKAVVIARNAAGERVLATASREQQDLQPMMAEDMVGVTGHVKAGEQGNTFSL